MTKPLDLYMVEHATARNLAYIEVMEREVEARRTDAHRKDRLKARECRWCFYRRGILAGQGFTDWNCRACGTLDSHANTAVPHLCNECSDRLGLCVRCCADIELKRRKTLVRK